MVDLVIPHPGQGMWYNNFEGQTIILVCPSDFTTATSHTTVNM